METIQTVLSSFAWLLPVTLAQSLILSFVPLAIMIPFRILNFQDMTSEGAFPLGGCVCAVSMTAGFHPLLALALGTLAGFAAGCCTALIHLRFRIHTLLAGILMMTMLYSVDLRIMGRSNLSVFGAPQIYEWTPFKDPNSPLSKILVAGFFVIAAFTITNLFRKPGMGTAVREGGGGTETRRSSRLGWWSGTGWSGGCPGGPWRWSAGRPVRKKPEDRSQRLQFQIGTAF